MYNIFCPDILFTEQCNLRCTYCFESKTKMRMDKDKLISYLNERTNVSYFPFGGEPMLEFDTLKASIVAVQNMNIPDRRKNKLYNSMQKIITNGTLIEQHLEESSKYGLSFQISMDGPKHIHDRNRVFADGKTGSYDIVLRNIDAIETFNVNLKKERDEYILLHPNEEIVFDKKIISWYIHGVVSQDMIKDIFEISKWHFEFILKYQGLEKAIDHLGSNCYQIIFEESYIDKDVDDLINGVAQFCDWIWGLDYSIKIKQKLIHSFLTRRGGVCSLGTTLAAIDTDFNIYPCHRLASGLERERFCLGNVYHPREFKNFQIYNQSAHQRYRSKESYSSHVDVNFDNDIHWFMWCPATNFEETKSIYYQNPRYNLMHYELNRFIKQLFKKYKIRR